MDATASHKPNLATARQLASLKIVSRLLAHELHAQSSSKSITLSKDEVVEIQTCVDLFIEEASRRPGAPQTYAASGLPSAAMVVDAPLAIARGN